MHSRAIIFRFGLMAAILASVGGGIAFLSKLQLIPSEFQTTVVYGVIVLVGGVLVVRSLGNYILKSLKPSNSRGAYTLSSLVKVFGYVLVGIFALAMFGVGPEAALAGGTFSGLVVGLAAQPVLSNFFAGMVVLLARFVQPGDEVRLSSTELPYQWAFLPAYKYFSPDYIYAGYRGKIVEIGLLYSTLVTDMGLELRIPNKTILNSAIVNYSPGYSEERLYQVRYEFRVDHEPDLVLDKVKRALNQIPSITNVLVNEQSDKEYYIVLIEFRLKIGENWKHLKSEILKKLITVHRSLKEPASVSLPT